MKSLSTLIIGCAASLSVAAQNVSSIVTIKLNSNRNKEILVDGKSYSTPNVNKLDSIVITDLQPGQHTLQIVRNNRNNANNSTTSFNVRQRYDLQITVDAGGGIQQKEIKVKRNANSPTVETTATVAMSTKDFNKLLQGVKSQTRATARNTAVDEAFDNLNNNFTTAQAKQLLLLINSEASRLELAKTSYRSITDKENFNQISLTLNSVANRLELTSYIDNYTGNTGTITTTTTTTPTTPNPSTGRTPMADAAFNSLVKEIQQKWLPGAKLASLTSTFANNSNYFSADQTKQLIQLVSEENNRLQLAKSAYRNLTDPGNYTRLNDILNTQSSRDALAVYVNNYNYGNTSQNKTPMADANFSATLKDVQSKWLPGAKLAALTGIFASADNYFTASQAKQLIQLVSDETNRLQLAKSSYRNVVDPSNFSQMNELLNTQASRDELTAYVASYAKY